MGMTVWHYVVAYFVVCVVGHLAVAGCMYIMRWLVLKKENRPPFPDWSVFLVGATERAVALTLVLFAPPYLPTFIGGWVLLKFAIGWQRENFDTSGKHNKQVGEQSFLALIGSVISFAIAVGVGVWLNPAALEIWAKPHGS
jgi:hypothetical protein